jgi:hypothetical protein
MVNKGEPHHYFVYILYVLGAHFNKENSDKLVLVHLLVEIINLALSICNAKK